MLIETIVAYIKKQGIACDYKTDYNDFCCYKTNEAVSYLGIIGITSQGVIEAFYSDIYSNYKCFDLNDPDFLKKLNKFIETKHVT